MLNGFYAIYFTGVTGSGIGIIAASNGVLSGADAAGGIYDGTYQQNATTKQYDAKIKLTVPPGTSLVTGALAGTQPMSIDIVTILPENLGNNHPVTIDTPTGKVNVIFKKLRDFPANI